MAVYYSPVMEELKVRNEELKEHVEQLKQELEQEKIKIKHAKEDHVGTITPLFVYFKIVMITSPLFCRLER